MKQVFRSFLYVFPALLMAACAGLKPVSVVEWPTEQTDLTDTLYTLYTDVSRASESVSAVEGYADIWLRSSERKEHLYSAIQLERSKDMRLIVSTALLGWPVADILFRPDTLFVHDLVNNTLLVGSNNPGNLDKILGVKTRYAFLSDLLAGVIAAEEPRQAIRDVRTGSGSISFAVESGDGTKVLLVNQLKKIIEGVRFFDSSGRMRAEVHFMEYTPCVSEGESLELPRRIEVITFDPFQAGRKQELIIAYDERICNPAGLDIQYSVPKKARVVELDKVMRLPWM